MCYQLGEGPGCVPRIIRGAQGVTKVTSRLAVWSCPIPPHVALQDNEKRLVRQFQFHGWPEVGVPSPAVLIEFIREVQKLCQTLPPSNGPIVVHCRYVSMSRLLVLLSW